MCNKTIQRAVILGLLLCIMAMFINSTECSKRKGTSTGSSDTGQGVFNPPDSPQPLSATAISSYQISLQWTNVANELGYKIERKKDGDATFSQIATTGTDIVTYLDTSLLPNTTYIYKVKAWNDSGDSNYSNEASATTLTTIIQPPAAPSGLTTTAITSSRIDLTWGDVANELGYRIERKTESNGTYSQIGTTGQNVVTYSNTGLTANTTYFYRVKAWNEGGDSPYSNEINAKTNNFDVKPK